MGKSLYFVAVNTALASNPLSMIANVKKILLGLEYDTAFAYWCLFSYVVFRIFAEFTHTFVDGTSYWFSGG
nr:hypothetical protein [Coxiella endosymbiont of Ornithodoros amblus]